MAWFQSQEILAPAQHLRGGRPDLRHGWPLRSSTRTLSGGPLPASSSATRLGQRGLWRFGISGDLPIVLVRIGDVSRIDLVKQALQAHAYWRIKGLAADLVILNEDFSGYRAVLQDEIMGLINAGPEAAGDRQARRGVRPASGRAVRRGPSAVPDGRPRGAHRHVRDSRRAGTAAHAGRALTGSSRALAPSGGGSG